MADLLTFDLFRDNATRPGSLGCRAEIAATVACALKRAADRGLAREEIAARMGAYLGEKIGAATLSGYAAQSHTAGAADRGEPARDISLLRALAFDAAVEEDALLALFAEKRGARRVVSSKDAALLAWARLHQQEKELAERKRALETVIRLGGKDEPH